MIAETVPAARTRGPVWARELAQLRGMLEVMNCDILRQGHPLLSKDHMVCVAQVQKLFSLLRTGSASLWRLSSHKSFRELGCLTWAIAG